MEYQVKMNYTPTDKDLKKGLVIAYPDTLGNHCMLGEIAGTKEHDGQILYTIVSRDQQRILCTLLASEIRLVYKPKVYEHFFTVEYVESNGYKFLKEIPGCPTLTELLCFGLEYNIEINNFMFSRISASGVWGLFQLIPEENTEQPNQHN